MINFASRTVIETPTLTVGFTPRLGNRWIVSAEVTCELHPSSPYPDPSPSATLKGSPLINADVLIIEGVRVKAAEAIEQQVQNGVVGNTYVYRFKATLNEATVLEEDLVQKVTVYAP